VTVLGLLFSCVLLIATALAVLMAKRLHMMRLIVNEAAIVADHIPRTKHFSEVCQPKVDYLHAKHSC